MKTLDTGESRVKKNSPKITARNNTIFLLRFQREKTFVACFRLRDKLDKFYNGAFHLLHNIVSNPNNPISFCLGCLKNMRNAVAFIQDLAR